MVAEAVKAFEALAPVANPMKRLTRSATGRRKWWRSARSVKFTSDSFFTYNDPPSSIWNGWTLFAIVVGVNLVGYLFYWMFFSVRRSS